MTDTYCYLHLRGEGRSNEALHAVLRNDIAPRWRQAGITVWGVWEGIFGVASNELIVVAMAGGERVEPEFTDVLADSLSQGEVGLREKLLLAPTVRPSGMAPCDKAGLYVFRFFEVSNADTAEIAELSRQAWETFENSDAYQTEPQGLFRTADRATERGRMLLVTWYDGLDSWQLSRKPAPEATANFLRRRELTEGTVALATRLSRPPE